MTEINKLIDKYNCRVPYEDRGKEYDTRRKRVKRQNELKEIALDLFVECENYKQLKLTSYQKERVIFLVNKFGGNFKKLHAQAKKEAIILSFIFYIKLIELSTIDVRDYKISSEYGLSNKMFLIIVCRLCEYFMKSAPIVPYGTTEYNHEVLSKNGGRK